MKLISLDIENVRQHAHSRIEFPDAAVIGICGENESGKSTVLEALTWALFGTKAIRGSKASFRWNRAPTTRKATVRLEFEVAGTRYVVERDEGSASVRLAGALELLASGTSAVDAYVPELIGMSLDEFAATFLCEQKSIDRIASMKPTERQTFIREVMQIGRIDDALVACRKRKNALSQEAGGLEQGLGDRAPLVAERDGAKAAVVEAHNAFDAAQTAAKAASEAAADAAEELQHLAALFDQHTAASRELAAAEDALSSREHERDTAEAEREKAEHSIDRLEAADEQLAELPALRERKEQLVAARAQAGERASLHQLLSAAEHDVRKYSDELATIDAAIGAYDPAARQGALAAHQAATQKLTALRRIRTDGRAAAEAEAGAVRKELQLTRRRIEEIERRGAEGDCPTCQRVLGAQLDYVLGALRSIANQQEAAERTHQDRADAFAEPDDDELATAAEVDAALEALQQQVELERDALKARKDRPDIVRQLDEAQRAHAERSRRLTELPAAVEYSAEALQSTTARITQLDALEKEVAPLRGDVARMPELARKHEAAIAAAADAEQLALLRRRALEAIPFDQQAYDQADEACTRLRDYRTEAQTALARAEGAASAAGDRLTRAEASLASYDGRAEKLTALRTQIHTHEAAARRLDEFRDEQVQLLRPELEALVSGFVSLLTDGRHESVTVDDTFNVVLQESGIDMEVISGGTEDLAAIALRLAISQMIAERAGHPLSLLILDEPFGSLSEVRRANVLNLIRQLGDLFTQVLLISHVDETKHAVDHVIEITFDEGAGCSRITQSTSPPREEQQLAGAAA